MPVNLEERLAQYRETLDAAIADDLVQRRPEPLVPTPSSRKLLLSLAAAGVIFVCLAALAWLPAKLPDSIPTVNSGSQTPTVVSAATPSVSQDNATDFTPLSEGSSGEEVRELQERLMSLGYDLDGVDGVFGVDTQWAVWAFEKLQGGVGSTDVTGVVTLELWEQISTAAPPTPREESAVGSHVEIYLPEQVLAMFDRDRKAVFISHMSSGDGSDWCEQVTVDPGAPMTVNGAEVLTADMCGSGSTPGGAFSVYRVESGLLDTVYGPLLDPVFFNYGITIHGGQEVVSSPSTRGGVEIPAGSALRFRDLMLATLGELPGVAVVVWDGIDEPSDLGAQLPIFPWLDPKGAPDAPATDVEIDQPEASAAITRLAIGDMVMLGAAPQLTDAGFVVDARESRAFIELVEIAGALNKQDRLGDVIVVSLGTNGPILENDMESAMLALRDVPTVVFLTVRADRDYTEPNNLLIRALPDMYPNVIVLDWATESENCLGDCFYDDQIHLRPDGQKFYTALVEASLGAG